MHADLKDALDIDEYVKVYQNFADVSNEVIAEVKKATSAKSCVKREKEERIRSEEAKEEAREERLRKECRRIN